MEPVVIAVHHIGLHTQRSRKRVSESTQSKNCQWRGTIRLALMKQWKLQYGHSSPWKFMCQFFSFCFGTLKCMRCMDIGCVSGILRNGRILPKDNPVLLPKKPVTSIAPIHVCSWYFKIIIWISGDQIKIPDEHLTITGTWVKYSPSKCYWNVKRLSIAKPDKIITKLQV